MTIAMNERLKEFVRRLDQALGIVERARIRALTADYRELPGYPEGWADRIDWTGYPERLQENYRNLIQSLARRRQAALEGGFPELGPRGNERGTGLGLSKGVGEWCHDRSVMDALYSLEAFFMEKPLPAP
jgi:hypothetical protein